MYTKRLIKEIWLFVKINRKLLLAPVIIVTLVVAGILILIQDTAVSPMIYTVF